MGASEDEAGCDCDCHRRDSSTPRSHRCVCHNESHPIQQGKCKCSSENGGVERATANTLPTGGHPELTSGPPTGSSIQTALSTQAEPYPNRSSGLPPLADYEGAEHGSRDCHPWVHVVIVLLAVVLMAVTAEFVSVPVTTCIWTSCLLTVLTCSWSLPLKSS